MTSGQPSPISQRASSRGEHVAVIEALFLVSLIAPPSPEWEQWTKLILSIAVPLLLVSGGLFFVAWKAFKSGKDVWTTLAVEFLLTKTFDEAVSESIRQFITTGEFETCINKIRREAERDFIERIRVAVEHAVTEHNSDTSSHYVWRHGEYNQRQAQIEQRLWELEKKRE